MSKSVTDVWQKASEVAAEINKATLQRIMANDPQPLPILAISIHEGLIRPLAMMEADCKRLLAVQPSAAVKEVAEKLLPRQRARIIEALFAAAQAAECKDISAPANDASIDAFLSHIDQTWFDFYLDIFEARERANIADLTPGQIVFWKFLWEHAGAVSSQFSRVFVFSKSFAPGRLDCRLSSS